MDTARRLPSYSRRPETVDHNRERDTIDRISQNGVAPTTFEDQKSESKIPNINSVLIFHLLLYAHKLMHLFSIN